MPQVNYRVHSVAIDKVPTEAKLPDGRTVMAHVDGLTVELVDGDTHSHIFRFMPRTDAEMSELRALYTEGATIVSTHSAG